MKFTSGKKFKNFSIFLFGDVQIKINPLQIKRNKYKDISIGKQNTYSVNLVDEWLFYEREHDDQNKSHLLVCKPLKEFKQKNSHLFHNPSKVLIYLH